MDIEQIQKLKKGTKVIVTFDKPFPRKGQEITKGYVSSINKQQISFVLFLWKRKVKYRILETYDWWALEDMITRPEEEGKEEFIKLDVINELRRIKKEKK